MHISLHTSDDGPEWHTTSEPSQLPARLFREIHENETRNAQPEDEGCLFAPGKGLANQKDRCE